MEVKDLAALRRREAALQIQVAQLTLENIELRREVSNGWQAAEPSVLQVLALLVWHLCCCVCNCVSATSVTKQAFHAIHDTNLIDVVFPLLLQCQ